MSLRKLLLYIFVIGTASAVILPTITNQKEPIESNISIQISQSEVNSCLNRISEKTGYDRTRLNHIGNDGESIVVTYLNDFGNIHKFKCDGNGVKLWAKGAEMWIDM